MTEKIRPRTSAYASLHQWVRRQLGKPKMCIVCGTTEDKRYEWANLSGEYKRDLSDWGRMCVPCHGKFDGRTNKTHCPQGHPYDEENTYRKPSGFRECRECRRKLRPYSKERKPMRKINPAVAYNRKTGTQYSYVSEPRNGRVEVVSQNDGYQGNKYIVREERIAYYVNDLKEKS